MYSYPENGNLGPANRAKCNPKVTSPCDYSQPNTVTINPWYFLSIGAVTFSPGAHRYVASIFLQNCNFCSTNSVCLSITIGRHGGGRVVATVTAQFAQSCHESVFGGALALQENGGACFVIFNGPPGRYLYNMYFI
jgi:hypothetical protein